jgi:ABC-2 type transport system permease protein
MSPVLVLFRKEFTRFRRSRFEVLLTFAIPFVMIFIFGEVFGINRNENGPAGIPLAVINASADPAAGRLYDALLAEKAFKAITVFTLPDGTKRPLAEADLRPLMRANQFRFALVIPADLFSPTAPGIHLKIYSNPRNEIETQTVNGILQRTIFASVPQLLGQSLQARARNTAGEAKADAFNRALAESIAGTFGGKADEILQSVQGGGFGLDRLGRGTDGGDGLTQLVRIETEQVIGRDVRAAAATRVVGGWAVQFLLFALSAGATALFYERDQGIFQRILAGPVTRAQILWAKFLWGVSLGVLQLMVLFAGGRLLYGIDVEHHLGMLALVCVFASGSCTSFGMLLASLVRTRETAMGLATFFILMMCAVGGAWFPVTLMPASMQPFSRLTVVYWAMEGFDQVLWANAPLSELLPTLGVLGGITVVVMALALWRFNRSRIFD